MPRIPPAARAAGAALVALLALAPAGCGAKKYPVVGKVVYPDGSPFPGGMLVCSPLDPDSRVGARGYIEPDGTSPLSPDAAGDGPLEGKSRVLVRPPAQGGEDAARPKVPLLDPRFTQFDTSGLQFEVKPE